MNVGGVEEWLKQCPEKKRKQIMQLAFQVPHTCFTCWWLQFNPDSKTRVRGCKVPELKFRKIPEGLTWRCQSWRIDPDAQNREQGTAGFVI